MALNITVGHFPINKDVKTYSFTDDLLSGFLSVYREEAGMFSDAMGHDVDVEAFLAKLRVAVQLKDPDAHPIQIFASDRVYFAILEGKVVAGCTVATQGVHGVTSWHIGSVFVVPEHRRKGIATNLMRVIEDEAYKNKVPLLDLGVYEARPDVKALYMAMGYVPYETKMAKKVGNGKGVY